ncbi:TetR/AcrR family transcriptional regulator [Halopseudomonas nanhaiensis]|uniref:TetR/AcrR family transcriptional regulator n=1 Tax=Halopseudomonas nanhaiensis TaxID=2830842 RepID=UPI001CBF9407|nr:TetR/AcrR family transcriptional regulator [Halopseudomonas nanhaiensis]UAW99758.1 TetR/AcrR family transcriptional regulator [Halopseudomonas nanhaiensis]
MPEHTSNPAKRQRKSAEQRREDILVAAGKVFAEQGFRCAEVQQIADLAGIGKGTIYRFYATKDELFKAAVDAAMQRLTGRVDASIEHCRDPLLQLRAAFRAYIEFFREHPETVELFIHERAELRGSKPLYFVYSEARRRRWVDICQQLIERYPCRVKDPELVLDALANLAYGSVFVTRISERRVLLDDEAEKLTDLLFNGILGQD